MGVQATSPMTPTSEGFRRGKVIAITPFTSRELDPGGHVMKRLLTCGIIVIGITGCATTPPRPSVQVYPARGQNEATMSRDMADCQAWARQQTGYDPVADTAKGVGIGALVGGALGAGGGAAVGAASGNNVGKSAATGAVIGGVAGGVAGGVYKYSKSKEGYEQAYSACMNGRGYASGVNAGAMPATTVAVAPPPPVVVQSPPPVVVQSPPRVVVAPAPPPPPPASIVVVEPRRIHVPPGHYPAPGYCRLWYPGRPPGHQPSAFACRPVAVPSGAFILYNGVAWDGDYNWRSHARRHPGSVPPVILEITAGR